MDYKWTPEQKERWSEYWAGHLKRGMKTQIAKAIAKAREGGLESWKTMMTTFFQGAPVALKAVFDHPKRLDIVAGELGYETNEFEYLCKRLLQGDEREDDFSEVRIPGFEDFGAISAEVAVRFLRYEGGSSCTPSSMRLSEERSLLIDVETETSRLIRRLLIYPNTEHCLIRLISPFGVGREWIFRALYSRLKREGRTVYHWKRSLIPEDDSFIFCEMIQRLSKKEKNELSELVKKHNLVLVCTGDMSLNKQSFGLRYHMTFRFRKGNRRWGRRFIDELETVFREEWEQEYSFARLRNWFENKLWLEAFGWNPGLLGALARSFWDSDKEEDFLLSPTSLLEVLLDNLLERLKSKETKSVATLFKMAGRQFFVELGGEFLRQGQVFLTKEMLFRVLSKKVGEQFSNIGQEALFDSLNPSDFYEAFDALLEIGWVYEKDEKAFLEMPAIGFLSAGSWVGQNLENLRQPEFWNDLFQNYDSKEVSSILIATVYELDELTSLFELLLGLPPFLRTESLTQMTALLTTGLACEREILQKVCLLSLSRWVASPSMRLNDKIKPEAFLSELVVPVFNAPAPLQWSLSQSPLLFLAHAFIEYKDDLPEKIDIEDLMSPGELLDKQWLSYFDCSVDEELRRYLLCFGAPFRSREFLSPGFWKQFTPEPEGYFEGIINFIPSENWHIWFSWIKDDLFLSEKGSLILSGLEPGFSIVSFLWENTEAPLWKKSLKKHIFAMTRGAEESFSELVVHFVWQYWLSGGMGVLLELWSEVRNPEPRALIRDAVMRDLKKIIPSKNLLEEKKAFFVQWLLGELLTREQTQELWLDWTTRDEVVHIPWLQFWKSGIMTEEVVRWAIRTQHCSTHGRESQNVYDFFLDEENVEKNPVIMKMILLEAHEPDPEKSYHSRWNRTLQALYSMESSTARRCRIEAVADCPDNSLSQLVQSIQPRPEELQYWLSLLLSPARCYEYFKYWAALMFTLEGRVLEIPYLLLRQILLVMETEEEEGWQEFCQVRAQLRALAEELSERPMVWNPAQDREHFESLRKDVWHEQNVIYEFLNSFVYDNQEDVFRKPFESTFELLLNEKSLRGAASFLWSKGLLWFGEDYIIERLLNGMYDWEGERTPTVARLENLLSEGYVDFVVSLLNHEQLSVFAIKAMFAKKAKVTVEVVEEELHRRCLVGDNNTLETLTLNLAFLLLQLDEERGLFYFENTLLPSSLRSEVKKKSLNLAMNMQKSRERKLQLSKMLESLRTT